MTVFQVSQGLQDVVARSRSRYAIPEASLSFEEKYRNRRINQTLNKFHYRDVYQGDIKNH